MLPIVQLLGLIPLIYIYNQYGIDRNVLKVPSFLITTFIIFLTTIYLLNITLIDTISSPSSIIGIVLCLMVFLIMYSVNITTRNIYSILTKMTIVLLIFWFIQFISFYIFDYRIDYFIDIVGYKQRTNLGAFGEAFFRPASLFVEPAMYVNTMLLLFYFRLLYNNLKLDNLNIFIIFSVLMTFSTYGYVAFGILGFSWLIVRRKYIFISILILSVVSLVLIFLGELESNMIIRRLMNPLEDMSGKTRIVGNILNFVEQSVFHLLFGFGWGQAELNGFQGSSLHYLLYNTGIIGLLCFMLIMYLIIVNKKYKYLTILVVLLSLLNNSSALVSFFNWTMFGFIFRLKYYKLRGLDNATTK